MLVMQVTILVMVALAGTAVVLTRDPRSPRRVVEASPKPGPERADGMAQRARTGVEGPTSQAIGLSFYGILLGLMFFIYQAPDVALSQIVIGAVALPLMVMLTLAKIRFQAELAERRRMKEDGNEQEKAA